MSKKKDMRHAKIRQILLEEDRIRISDLAERLQVTPETLRSDLNELESQKLVRREHGYASNVSAITEIPILMRGKENVDLKRRIAFRAMQQVQDGQTIFLDSGTTVLEGLPYLANKKDLTVVTNSIPLAYQAGTMDLNIIVCGGQLLNVGLRTYGHYSTDIIDHMIFDVAIMGSDGLESSPGFTALSFQEVPFKRHVMNRSDKIIMLMDNTKFSQRASYSYCKFNEVDCLVTNHITDQQLEMVKDVKKIIQV